MTTALEELRSELDSPSNQDIPLESIKDVFNELLDRVESENMNGAKVIGPFILTFSTSDLFDLVQDGSGGALLWSPNIGDWVLDVWVRLLETFSGAPNSTWDFELFIHRQRVASDNGFWDYQNGHFLGDGSNTLSLAEPTLEENPDLPWYRRTYEEPPGLSGQDVHLVGSRGWNYNADAAFHMGGNPFPFLVTGELEIRAWTPVYDPIANYIPTQGQAEVYALVQDTA